MPSSTRAPGFQDLSNPNKGTKAPTGKYKPETGLAKKQQHHDRPEYAAQTAAQSKYIMGGVDRKEAKRMAKADSRVPKRK